MKVFFDCVVRGVEQRERVDTDTGEKTTKYRTRLDDSETGQRLEVNCKKDFTEYKDETGVAEILIYDREGGGFWLTLSEFYPKAGIDISK